MRGRETPTVWLLLAATAAAILVTYSRLRADQLYHVSGTGLGGGASWALVFLNFPAALIAIGALAVSSKRLRRSRRVVAVVAALLCLPVFWPGVVDPGDLDARWVNAGAGLGVALAVVVTMGIRGAPGALRADPLRVVVAVAVLLAAPPWLAAEAGFCLEGVPLLGRA